MKRINTYSTNEQETICPYCEEITEHDAESLTWNDGEQSEVQCSSCEKIYIQEATVLVRRQSLKMEEVEEDE